MQQSLLAMRNYQLNSTPIWPNDMLCRYSKVNLGKKKYNASIIICVDIQQQSKLNEWKSGTSSENCISMIEKTSFRTIVFVLRFVWILMPCLMFWSLYSRSQLGFVCVYLFLLLHVSKADRESTTISTMLGLIDHVETDHM